jgi:hypothetical protein|tara:strand:- start:278 stop:721 length:444 start_codon:yes stop_codon:yes gene_type:complete
VSKGQLQSWLDEEWVRMDSKGNIIGSCGGRKKAEGKPRCLPKKKAQGMSKEARAKIVQRKRRKDPNPNRKGKPINVSTKLKKGGEVKLSKKADLNKDGKFSEYEKARGMAIQKAMSKQNKVKMKKGGFIAKGCGKVMSNKRKVTTIS